MGEEDSECRGTLLDMLLPLALLFLCPCAQDPPAEELAPTRPQPYEEQLAGTTLSFEMLPIEAGTAEPGRIFGLGVGFEEREIAPFYMARFELTWDLYDVFVFGYDVPRGEQPSDGVTRPTRPYIAADHGFGHAGYPALSISHNGAQAFVEWLRVKTGRKYRLPTEEEWEWASRAGAVTPWFFGEDEEQLEQFAWLRNNSKRSTHPVGEKPANPWGLHDIYGNVAEWCTAGEGEHVLRGGAYLDRKTRVDSVSRKVPTPAWNANDPQIPRSIWWLTDGSFAGFRVVCEMEGDEPARAGD